MTILSCRALRRHPWAARILGAGVIWLGLCGVASAADSFGSGSWIGGTVKEGETTVSVGGQVFATSLDFNVGADQGFSFDARGTYGLYDGGTPYVLGATITGNLTLRLTNFSYLCRQASCDASEFRTYFYARGISGFFEDPIMTGLSMEGGGSMAGAFRVDAFFGGYDGGFVSPLLVLDGTLPGSAFSLSTGTFPKYRGTGRRFDPISLQLSLPSATAGQTLDLPHSLASSIITTPVPEASTGALLAVGAGTLGWIVRRRRPSENPA
jgi:hypothetical protein